MLFLGPGVEVYEGDELLEVTPLAHRIRKRTLGSDARGKQIKRAKEALLDE